MPGTGKPDDINRAGGIDAVLDRLRLDGVTQEQPVSSLSGGEKVRDPRAQADLKPIVVKASFLHPSKLSCMVFCPFVTAWLVLRGSCCLCPVLAESCCIAGPRRANKSPGHPNTGTPGRCAESLSRTSSTAFALHTQ